jgi:hypothetical protein
MTHLKLFHRGRHEITAVPCNAPADSQVIESYVLDRIYTDLDEEWPPSVHAVRRGLDNPSENPSVPAQVGLWIRAVFFRMTLFEMLRLPKNLELLQSKVTAYCRETGSDEDLVTTWGYKVNVGSRRGHKRQRDQSTGAVPAKKSAGSKAESAEPGTSKGKSKDGSKVKGGKKSSKDKAKGSKHKPPVSGTSGSEDMEYRSPVAAAHLRRGPTGGPLSTTDYRMTDLKFREVYEDEIAEVVRTLKNNKRCVRLKVTDEMWIAQPDPMTRSKAAADRARKKLKALCARVSEHAEAKSASADSDASSVSAKAVAKAGKTKAPPSLDSESFPCLSEGAEADLTSGDDQAASAKTLPVAVSCRVPTVSLPPAVARATTAPSQSRTVASTTLTASTAAPPVRTPYVQQVVAPRGPVPRGEAARAREAAARMRGRVRATDPRVAAPGASMAQVVSGIRPLGPALPTPTTVQQSAAGAYPEALELGAELGSPPLPPLSSRGLYNLSEVFREAAHRVSRREMMLPGQLRTVQYFTIPPGALTLFRTEVGVRVVQHLAPCVGYCTARVPPGQLGFPEVQLLQEAVEALTPPAAISDMTRMDFEAELGSARVSTAAAIDAPASSAGPSHPTQAARGSAPETAGRSTADPETMDTSGDGRSRMSGID